IWMASRERSMRRVTAGLMILAAAGLVTRGEEPGSVAVSMLERCREGKFVEATEKFAPAMLEALPAAKLAQTWRQIEAEEGEAKSVGKPQVTKSGEYTRVRVRVGFAKMPLDAHVSFDKEGKIAGFFLRPASGEGTEDSAPPPEAPYADRSKFDESRLMVG